MEEREQIVRLVLDYFPETQAIYLFGTFATTDMRSESDVDIAVLLTPHQAKEVGFLGLSTLRFKLEELLERDIDLINLRQAPTVLQKEVIMAEQRIFCANEYAAAEFEMLTLSFYQKLNEERAAIIQDILESGRIIV